MHLTKKISVLDRKRVSLEFIRANCNNPILMEDDAAMLLAAINLHAAFVGERDQFLMLG